MSLTMHLDQTLERTWCGKEKAELTTEESSLSVENAPPQRITEIDCVTCFETRTLHTMPLTLEELMSRNGGKRPVISWECHVFVGGCGACYMFDPHPELKEGEYRRCFRCNDGPVMKVTIYNATKLELKKELP